MENRLTRTLGRLFCGSFGRRGALRLAASAAVVAAGISAAQAEIRDDYVKVSDDLTIHYQETGTGKIALIFVPGWTMSTKFYEHQLSHFEDSKDFRAISYDPRSQGSSSQTIEGHYYEQHARDLDAFLQKVKADRFVLIGWSAGGGDVLEYVRVFGASKLAGLVLLDTSPKVRTTDYTKEWAWFGTKDEGDQDGFMRAFSFDVMVDRKKTNEGFAQWMLDDPTPEKIRLVEEVSNHTPNSVAALLNTSYWFLDNVQQVKDLNGKVPLLYFTRAEWNQLATDWAKQNTPAATVVSFGKHLSFWEHPEKFNAALDEFLKQVK